MSFDQLTHKSLLRIVHENPNYILLLDGGLSDNIEARVNSIDPFTHRHWVYEGTDFDNQKEKGPLLVEIYINSSLLEKFYSEWHKEHLGIILKSSQPIQSIIEHFRNWRHAILPDRHPAVFRPYDPRKLRGFAEFYERRQYEVDSFLGPCHQIIWCEWHGDAGDWYMLTHSQETGGVPAQEPFMVSKHLLRATGEQNADYIARCITRYVLHMQLPELKLIPDQEIIGRVRDICCCARSLGYTNSHDMADYVKLKMRHGFIKGENYINLILSDETSAPRKRIVRAISEINEGYLS